MSHWNSGKIKVVCSIDVLVRALRKVLNEWGGLRGWEDYFDVDYDGKLSIENTYVNQTKHGFNVRIRHNNNKEGGLPSLNYQDIGLKWTKEGWEFDIENSAIRQKLEGKLKQDVGIEKALERAAKMGAKVVKINHGKNTVIEIDMPVDQYKMLKA